MSIRVQVHSAHSGTSDYVLEGPEVVIGRAATSAIVIVDSRVSRQHARLVLRSGDWLVEDLGARNPTLLNGEPMSGSTRLQAGDRLQVGDALVHFLGEPGQQPLTAAAAATSDAASTTAVPTGAARDAARMRTLNDIHRALAAPMTLAALLDLILERCFDVLQPEEGVIMLRVADGSLTTAASRRRGGGEVTVPRRLIDEVAGKGQPALVLDAADDARFSGSDSMMSSGIRSIVAAPLVDSEGTVGLIALSSRLAVRRFAPPDLDMLVSIASAAALRVRNVALADELASRRVIEHELALAHDVQMSLLPRALPRRPELALGAALRPARSVGGDLYDFVLDSDRLWFIVADVAGKSVAAALYMAIVRTLFRAVARDGREVEDVAARMNEELARDNDGMMFVTAAIGSLDLGSGLLALVDAGHNPAILAAADRAPAEVTVPKAAALGVVADAAYAAGRVTLQSGATLLLYTDGVTEARDAAGQMFGTEGLARAIDAAADQPPDALVSAIMAAVDRFVGGAPPEDDLTLLALRFEGTR